MTETYLPFASTVNGILWSKSAPLSVTTEEIQSGTFRCLGEYARNFDPILRSVISLSKLTIAVRREFIDHKENERDKSILQSIKDASFETVWNRTSWLVPPTNRGLNLEQTQKFFDKLVARGPEKNFTKMPSSQATLCNILFNVAA